EDANPAVFGDHIAVSLRAAYYCAQLAHPHLVASGGSMIVMTSGAGLEGTSLNPQYGVVKGALRGFAKALAREWGPEGIRVNAVSPLGRSPAVDQYMKTNPQEADAVLGIIALRRFGELEIDIAPAVAFLVSDAGRYITGQTMVVDGGRYTLL